MNYRGLPTRRCADCGATDEHGPMLHTAVAHSPGVYYDDHPVVSSFRHNRPIGADVRVSAP